MRQVCFHAGVQKAVEQDGCKIVFLTSPNNPDGSMIAEEDLLQILELQTLVVLDEAYIEFSTVRYCTQKHGSPHFPSLPHLS